MATATIEGLTAAGIDEARPMSSEGVLAMWRSKLTRGARDMLDVLVAAYPPPRPAGATWRRPGVDPVRRTADYAA
jgi:hypothetical protein